MKKISGTTVWGDKLGTDVLYEARGCEYTFEWYEGNADHRGVVVYCFNTKNELVWDGSTEADASERVVDTIRRARENYHLRKAEHGV